MDASAPEPAAGGEDGADPEREALLADSVGLALLVILDTLAPAERLAFVLHDLFAVPFEEIAGIVGRSPSATRQLASRARRRVQGAPAPDAGLASQRKVVETFLAALRSGDFDGLLAVLDPDVVVRADQGPGKAPREVRGARTWAQGAIAFSRALQSAQPALVDGSVGIILAPRGRLSRAIRFTIVDGKIVEVAVVINPERLRELDLAVLDV